MENIIFTRVRVRVCMCERPSSSVENSVPQCSRDWTPINYYFTDLPTLVVAMLAYSIHYALCIVLWYYAYELVCISYSRRVITQTMNPKGRWQ